MLISGAMYWYCISNFTNLPAVQTPIWPISNISNSIVRYILGYHLWKLNNRNWVLPTIIAVFCVIIPADATYFAVELCSIDSYQELWGKSSWSLYFGLPAEAIGDLIIAVAQCAMLRSLETGIRRSDTIVRTLVVYSISTGMLTSLCALAALIAYAVNHTTFIYFAFYFVLSKRASPLLSDLSISTIRPNYLPRLVYVNALLARLNARGSLLESKSDGRGGQAPESTLVFGTPNAPTGLSVPHAHDAERTCGTDTSGGIEVGSPLDGHTLDECSPLRA
ncbi:hypothetical protein BC628DRAFT_1424058 [Trametes gibbosa]|nr:hypothetical protein BC628DRAFT_1424058 [Trametes gibbosa]